MEKKKLVEAALFMSPKALSAFDLGKTINTTSREARALALELMNEFNQRDSALEITQIEDSFQMRVNPGLEQNVSHLAAESEFSKSIMTTLALISFKQPIQQSLVVKYRNNKAYDHVAKLLEEGFITKEPAGRTYTLRTTRKFLEYFGESGLQNQE